ncbi:MAG TPA: phospholipase D-like domain-containing protein [Vicinamibacterales bacterium]|nr:phospholipase D-like domain-containing protein [Vicinamibacterales bacterium]
MQAIRRAKKTVDIVIFRFDRTELEKALEAAAAKGVAVRALIAHTNRGGEKNLRKLELRLLAMGVTVARSGDDLVRYHGKMMIVDDAQLYVLAFNYTKLDVEKSRSFGVVTRNAGLVKEAKALFEADATRQPYSPGHKRFVVSPETSRKLLSDFLKRAKKQLLIYDDKITDKLILRLLQERAKAGVEIRVIGKIDKSAESVHCCKLADLRPHVRAIVRDGQQAFVGSQSLRKLQLDNRREIGVIVNDSRIAKRIQSVFEADWAQSVPKKVEKAAEEAISAAAAAK